VLGRDRVPGPRCRRLVYGVVVSGHPLRESPRVAAEESLYAAVENGLDADLRWLASNGEHTTDTDRSHTEVFNLARRGPTDRGLDAGTDISTAVDEMQREHRRRAAGADTSADWPG
jgi:hypothetical protein